MPCSYTATARQLYICSNAESVRRNGVANLDWASEQMKTYALIATTPRYHGLIETDICGSDFRNSDNSGANAPGPKNVNRPQEIRRFRFVANQSDYQVLHNAYEALDRNTMTAERYL